MQTGSLGTWQNQVCVHRCWLDLPTCYSHSESLLNMEVLSTDILMAVRGRGSVYTVCCKPISNMFFQPMLLFSSPAGVKPWQSRQLCGTYRWVWVRDRRVCVCMHEILSCWKWNSGTLPAPVCVWMQKKQATSRHKARNKIPKTYSPSAPLAIVLL